MSNNSYPLRLVSPVFDDPLTDLILELDHQRKFVLGGTSPPHLFFELKRLFHLLETLGSARIEGNRTTIAELVDRTLVPRDDNERIREVVNLEKALSWVEQVWSSGPETFRIDHSLIRELQRLVTVDLSAQGEGDTTPGQYRTGAVRISGAEHQPPEPSDVFPLMDELLVFLNREDSPKYDLIKIALVHHRFAWIHPFSNGNGRTVRLLTYAMLLKSGFRVGGAKAATRILNPTAVFCVDRNIYYQNLARADKGDDPGLLSWCSYVLGGLKTELEKVSRLLDFDWLSAHILTPAIHELHQKNGLSDHERAILLRTLHEPYAIKNADIRPLLGSLGQVQTSRILADLRGRKLLMPTPDSERKYQLGISESPLMRTVLRQLDREGFLPLKGEI